MCKSKKCSICRSKNYWLTEQLSALSRNHVQIEGPSAGRIIICWSNNYLQIEDLSPYQRIIFSTLNICRLKNYLMCSWNIRRLKNHLRIKVQSTDTSSFCQQFFNLQIVRWSAVSSSISRQLFDLLIEPFICLLIEVWYLKSYYSINLQRFDAIFFLKNLISEFEKY